VTGSVLSGFQLARIPTPRGPVLARVGGAGPRLLHGSRRSASRGTWASRLAASPLSLRTRSSRAQARDLLRPGSCICGRARAPSKALVSIHHTSVAAPAGTGTGGLVPVVWDVIRRITSETTGDRDARIPRKAGVSSALVPTSAIRPEHARGGRALGRSQPGETDRSASAHGRSGCERAARLSRPGKRGAATKARGGGGLLGNAGCLRVGTRAWLGLLRDGPRRPRFPPGMRWAHLPTWTLAVMENRALGREFRPNTKYSIRGRFRRRM
jgi:hypothetical protein